MTGKYLISYLGKNNVVLSEIKLSYPNEFDIAANSPPGALMCNIEWNNDVIMDAYPIPYTLLDDNKSKVEKPDEKKGIKEVVKSFMSAQKAINDYFNISDVAFIDLTEFYWTYHEWDANIVFWRNENELNKYLRTSQLYMKANQVRMKDELSLFKIREYDDTELRYAIFDNSKRVK